MFAFGGAFFRSDGGLDGEVLRVGFVASFGARILGLDGIVFSAGGYCVGGGITKNCVGRDAIGGFDGREGVVRSFGECEHALSRLRTVETCAEVGEDGCDGLLSGVVMVLAVRIPLQWDGFDGLCCGGFALRSRLVGSFAHACSWRSLWGRESAVCPANLAGSFVRYLRRA